MPVIIDGAGVNIPVNDPESMKETISLLGNEGSFINKVLVNSEAKTITDVLKAMPYYSTEYIIEIQTCSLDELIESTMASSREILPNLYHEFENIVEQFRSGDIGNGANGFSKVVPVLKWHVDVLSQLCSLHPGPSSIHDFFQRLSDNISELFSAWENEDFVLLCDLVQYEMVPWVEQWFQFIQLFEKQMAMEKMKNIH